MRQSYEVDEETGAQRLNNAETIARRRNWNLTLRESTFSVFAFDYYAILEIHCKVGIISSFHKLCFKAMLNGKNMNINY